MPQSPSQALATMRALRSMIAQRVESCASKTVHHVPAGFNGNIHWQIGHLIATPALLLYKRSDTALPALVDESMIKSFAKGTGPADGGDEWSTNGLGCVMLALVDSIENDLARGAFAAFKPYKTSAGVQLNTFEQALDFMAVHDGIHLGYTLALARAAA